MRWMRCFLLVYDRRQAKIVQQREYPEGQRERALDDARSLQLQSIFDSSIEVVILGGNSYEDLKKTHSRYFMTAEEIISAA